MNLVISLIFVLPLIFWPLTFQYEFPKLIFFYVISFFILIFLLLKKKQIFFDQSWLLWILVIIISSFFAGRIIPAFIGDGLRHQGIVFFLTLGLWGQLFNDFKRKNKDVLFKLLVSVSILEVLILIFGRLFKIPLFSAGTIGEINALAGYLLITIPFFFELSFWPLATIPIVGIFLTSSKTAISILILQLILIKFWPLFLKKKKLLILFLSLFLIFGIYMVFQERNLSTFESRWKIWQLGLKAFLEKPILGWGAEGLFNAYNFSFIKINLPLKNLVIDRSHNLFLDILLFSGIIGFYQFFKWFWNKIKRPMEKWQIISLLSLLFFSFFQPLGITLWLYFIFLLNYSKEPQNSKPIK